MKPTPILFTLTVAAFCYAACDSRQENAREDAVEKRADALEDSADATRKAGEKTADTVESQGKAGAGVLNPATPADKAATDIRKDAEGKADALEDKADAVREQN